jgi:hypothetical protein
MESPEQAHLACDEEVGVHALYPSGGGERSTIQGTILSPTGSPLFGANVLAISERRGTVMSSGLTDHSGNYSISGLEPGNYFVLAEPYFASSSALPPFYAGLTSTICPGNDSFGRTLLVENSGSKATQVQAPPGGTTAAPTLTVGCASGGAAITPVVAAESESHAPVIFNGLSETGFGVGDRFSSSSGTHFFRLQSVSGHLEIRALSFSLYSPIGVQLSLTSESGQPVNGQTLSPVYSGESGYVNYDAAFVADQLPLGDYIVQVSESPLNSTLFPAGPVSLDSVPFALITGTMNSEEPPLSSVIPFNGRCRMAENFAAYQSPPGGYPRSSSDPDTSSSGGCGMIDASGRSGGGSGGGNNGGGTSLPGIVGWFAPWLMMAAIARLLKSLARAQARS